MVLQVIWSCESDTDLYNILTCPLVMNPGIPVYQTFYIPSQNTYTCGILQTYENDVSIYLHKYC